MTLGVRNVGYKAEVSKTAKLEKYDLGILEFSSRENYAVAVMGEKPKTGDEVFVSCCNDSTNHPIHPSTQIIIYIY